MAFLKAKITSIKKVFKKETHTTYHAGGDRYTEENTSNEVTATVFQVQDAPNNEKLGHSNDDPHGATNSDIFTAFSTNKQRNMSQEQDNLGFAKDGQPTTATEGKTTFTDSSGIRTKELAPGVSITLEGKMTKKKKKKSKMQRLEGIHRRTSKGLTPPSYLCSGCTALAGFIMFISGMIMIILGWTSEFYLMNKSPGSFMRFGGGFFFMLGFLMMLIGFFYFLLVCLRHRGYFNKKDDNKPPPEEIAEESLTSDSESDDDGNTGMNRENSNTVSMTSAELSQMKISETPSESELSIAPRKDPINASQRSRKLPPISAPRSTLQYSNSRRQSLDPSAFDGSAHMQRDAGSRTSVGMLQMNANQAGGNRSTHRRASLAPMSSVSLTPRTMKKSNSANEFEMSDVSGLYTPRGTNNATLSPSESQGSAGIGPDKASVSLSRRGSVQMYMRNK